MTEYLFPSSIAEAVAWLEQKQGRARIIAGGTDLMPYLAEHGRSPGCLVDITHIPNLNTISVAGNTVEIGAAVTFATLAAHPFIRQHVAVLAQAACSVGAAPIRSVATLVGNIVQAMPAGDGTMAMLALEGEACIAGVEGSVWRPVESLFEGPGVSVVNPTSQMVTHVRFTLPAARWGTAWKREGRRPSLVLPILNCAVKLCVSPESDLIENAVIALGPVAPVPFRARDSENSLKGQSATSKLFERAGRIARDESNPRGSFSRASREHRLAIIPYLVSSALREAAESAMGALG